MHWLAGFMLLKALALCMTYNALKAENVKKCIGMRMTVSKVVEGESQVLWLQLYFTALLMHWP